MARNITKLICVCGCWVCMIYAASKWRLKAGAIVAIALIFEAIHAAIIMLEDKEDEIEDEYELEHYSCDGCKHHVGGGFCDQHLECECAEDSYKAWEDKNG